MRALLLSLLLINLAFAAWHIAFGSDNDVITDNREQQIAASYVDAPELVLVSERAKTQRRAGKKKTPEQAAADQYKPGEMCWLLGPFDEGELADNVHTRLLSMGVTMQLKRIASPVAPDYWVYVVPQDSRQSALQLLRDLQRRKIDSFIIAEGELENGISLGFYSNEKTARKALVQHQDRAYKVNIKVVARNIEEYWGLVRSREFKKLSEKAWNRFRSENGDLRLERKSCTAIASTGKLE